MRPGRATGGMGGVLVVALAGIVLLARPAAAQLGPGGAPGVVSTVAYDQLTPGLSIAVRPLDDTELNLAIKKRLEEELRRISRPLSDTAVLILSFETEVLRGRFSSAAPSLGSLEAGSEGTRFQLNVWSSDKDSILGGRKAAGPPRANVFHLSVTLRDERTGKALWQGDAMGEMLSPDTLRIAESMARPLITRLGRTATREPFDIE